MYNFTPGIINDLMSNLPESNFFFLLFAVEYFVSAYVFIMDFLYFLIILRVFIVQSVSKSILSLSISLSQQYVKF